MTDAITSPLIDDGHAEDLERLREFEVDYTPGPVVRQGLEWALRRLHEVDYITRFSLLAGFPGLRFLDPSAGAGVFGAQLDVLGHDPDHGTRWAVEPRPEERANLRRHYHSVASCRFEECNDFDGEPFDLIATNPPFSLWAQFLVRALDLVSKGGAVVLYGSIAWGQSSEGDGVFARLPPSRCARIVGRVHHRGPGNNPKTGKPWGSDLRDMCWWMWRKDRSPNMWLTENLPALPAEARRWTVRPGTE